MASYTKTAMALVMFSWFCFADPPKKTEKAKCDGIEAIVVSHKALVEKMAGSHVRDVMASQMTILQDKLRRRLMAKRGVESSLSLRKEVDNLVFEKIFKDANKKMGAIGSDAFMKLSDKEKEKICRSLLLRLGDFSQIEPWENKPWFNQNGSDVNVVPDEYLIARNTWIDEKKIEAWLDELETTLPKP